MNRTKIEYCINGYHWPIITGCANGPEICATWDKCWARMLHHRFGKSSWWCGHYDSNFSPHFNDDLINAPFTLRKPSRILVAFTGDMFSPRVPNEWIWDVLRVVRDLSQHQFLFLTKCPERLVDFNPWPDNAWVGSSITGAKSLLKTREAMKKVQAKIRWASFEPLLSNPRPSEPLRESHIYNWVVLGAQSGQGVKKPELAWVEDILDSANRSGTPVWLKNNLLSLYPELPKRQELP